MDDAMAALALAAGEASTRRRSLVDVINARKPTPMKEMALRCIKEQDIAHSRELLNLPPRISRNSVIIESTNWLIPEEPPQPRRGRKVKRITRRMKKEKEEKAAKALANFADLSRELINCQSMKN